MDPFDNAESGGVNSSVAGVTQSDLDRLVRGQKAKIAFSVTCLTVIEVIIGILSIDRLSLGAKVLEEGESEDTEDAAIDNGVVEVILFAIPFMLITNMLVFIAIGKDNVWLLLPWMVLHCVVIAFLALGAAILSAHGRGILGSLSLLGKYKLKLFTYFLS